MRELFDEVAGKSQLDPQEAVRRTTRGPQRKRFYTSAGVAEADGGFAVTLDGKPIRTPSGRPVIAPRREIADAIVAEWNAQGDMINPLSMPLTGSSAIDPVSDVWPLVFRSRSTAADVPIEVVPGIFSSDFSM